MRMGAKYGQRILAARGDGGAALQARNVPAQNIHQHCLGNVVCIMPCGNLICLQVTISDAMQND